MDSQFGAIVLCGGESLRMGRDKAWLPWGQNTTMLRHVVDTLCQAVPSRNVAVVAGRNQPYQAFSGDVSHIGESQHTAGTGPLGALMGGLIVFEGRGDVTACFACGGDAPLLKPEFIKKLFELWHDQLDVVVPSDEERLYPLSAVYRPACYRELYNSFWAGERSLHRVLRSGKWNVREIPVDLLREADPELDSLVNCNTPEDYETALRKAGLAD